MIKEVNTETLQIPFDFSGKRADVVFSRLLSGFTRSQIRRLIDERLILVEGKPIKPSKKLSGGETVSIKLLPPEPMETRPQNIPLKVLYEDDDIVVVNKAAGISVHPGAGIKEGTLVNALLYRCKGLSGIGGKIRPGIVHRLDKDTSGVMVVAKNDFAHQALIGQFKSREVRKSYIALLLGKVKGDAGSFSSPIGRHPTNRIKMSSRAKTGKEALTLWKVIKRYEEATMVEAEPRTGRTHQIRVHFADNGYPLLGDRVYGPVKHKSDLLNTVARNLGRHALHASTIGFVHPTSEKRVEFHAPLPNDMMEVINTLESRITE
jgi:23S rRNA pseudouridine1911/1915/1917 synthase